MGKASDSFCSSSHTGPLYLSENTYWLFWGFLILWSLSCPTVSLFSCTHTDRTHVFGYWWFSAATYKFEVCKYILLALRADHVFLVVLPSFSVSFCMWKFRNIQKACLHLVPLYFLIFFFNPAFWLKLLGKFSLYLIPLTIKKRNQYASLFKLKLNILRVILSLNVCNTSLKLKIFWKEKIDFWKTKVEGINGLGLCI